MSRYRGPKVRILKRLGSLPGFGRKVHQKFQKKNFQVNEHSLNTPKNKKKKKSSFSIRLKEKQKLRYHYGLTEKNLMQYVKKALKKQTSTGKTLLTGLEMRLDNIVFKLGFAPTLPAARQLITHGHICLNGKRRTIPSSQCSVNDLITMNKSMKTEMNGQTFPNMGQPHRGRPSFLSRQNFSGKVQQYASRKDINFKINELLVIEYYSRNL
uniref:Small ribosomal subunit protein uS4c n=1 Tax=Udotea flabellum TaxID=170437 RepID=A0A386B1T6_9CHLO|nr:ribosomal protein S4 [Udotea flabellum]AYC65660.1 ribosomal protein S4 [Udotea flabellum]